VQGRTTRNTNNLIFAQPFNVLAGLVPAIHARTQSETSARMRRHDVLSCNNSATFGVDARDIGERSDAVFRRLCAGMTRCGGIVPRIYNHFRSTGQPWACPGHTSRVGKKASFRRNPMTKAPKPAVVVTGASSGIGYACVEALIGAGFFVFGSVRSETDAARLQQAFGGSFAALLFDVRDEAAVKRAAALVEERLAGRALAGLVNNAGVAVPGPLLHLPIEEFRRQIETNVVGQLTVVQAFAPLLGARPDRPEKPGRIVNMSSTAGSLAAPILGAYAASKYALEGFSDALRRELMIFGIDVIVIEPGVIDTPIWEKAGLVDLSAYDGTVYARPVRRLHKWAAANGPLGAPPQRVAHAVLRALQARRPPARIPVLRRYFLDFLLPRLMPTRWMDWLFAKRLALLPQPAARARPDRVESRDRKGLAPDQ
jgi:NAD(P)-dependent dehydrogenase (short-subunit alcohol dehydrogenase family)